MKKKRLARSVGKNMITLIVNAYLFWGTWQDVKEREIGNLYLSIGAMGGLTFCMLKILTNEVSFAEQMMAWVPGIIFLFLAKMWEEKIGLGDGLVLLVLGNFIKFKELWLIVRISFSLLMIFSVLLLCSKKASKNCQIPFLPFLWISHSLIWGLQYV